MRVARRSVETRDAGSTPARVRDLVGYGALIVAPHPDDEVLGCGGLIASNTRPDAIDVLVLTDGGLSPPGAATNPELAALRRGESEEALPRLGLDRRHLRFLGMPDGQLADLAEPLDRALADAVHRTSASDVFVPFRFDRHPDHEATYAAGARLMRQTGIRLWEYFVYPRWRLLPGGDVRRLLLPEARVALPLTDEARRAKRTALDAYVTQTTRFVHGQARPVLGPAFLDRMCDGPEFFLRCEVARPGGRVLRRFRWWFHAIRRIEPPLKRARERLRQGGAPS